MPGADAQQATVTDELGGASLGAAVHTLFGVSWGRARAWIAAGKIAVGGERSLDARREVSAGEVLTLTPSAPRPADLVDSIEGAIVCVDQHFVVVNKPAGISTVPFEGERDTLDHLLQRALARRHQSRSGERFGLGVVHRLDRDTSGLLVFARSWLGKQRLGEQFREHTTHRRYLALANGEVQATTVRSHLLKDRGDGLRGSSEAVDGRLPAELGGRGDAPPPKNSKLAVTHIEVVEQLRGATLVACRLETGRTHQIRIHLSELGHPILGERAYGRRQGGLLAAPRMMLHAAELGFAHPATGARQRWEQPLPDDMQAMLARLRVPAR